MPPTELPTDEHVDLPWRRDSVPPPPPVLHLVVAWFLNEPSHVGHVARLDTAAWLGRGLPSVNEQGPVVFRQIRPGEALAGAPIDSTAVSRRQLLFEPEGERTVRVRSIGKRTLFHNGIPTTECVARAGDTLMLENTAVFLLEDRSLARDPLSHYPAPAFAFGVPDPDGLVGESPAAWCLRENLAAAASIDRHVLLVGQSGAGKELAATVVHRLSARASGPFIGRNAATFPSSLVDAELFGTARGYPNAGSPERDGLLAAADGGTLLLDEVGELPEEQQAHLLRVLDRGGEYQRLGEPEPRRSSFRLVAATNRDPATLKHDFLARFATVVDVPGLDQRQSDIPFLARVLLTRLAEDAPRIRDRFLDDGVPRLDPVLVDVLLRHRYTHHARELEKLLALSAATSPDAYLTATPEVLAKLRAEAVDDGAASEEGGRDVANVPADQIAVALRDAGGKVARAAETLGISRHALYRLMKKYGIDGTG